MRTKSKLFYVLGMCLALASCGNNESANSTNPALQLEQMPASDIIHIEDCGRGDGGKAVWIKCKGHVQTSQVVINGKIQTTNYYEDHLTAPLPQEYINNVELPLKIEVATFETNNKSFVFELGKDYKKISNGATEIAIISSGIGGDNNTGVWITCKGHTIGSKIYIGSTPLQTYYYEDHLTATIPQPLQGKILDSVYIKDDATLLQSVAITVQ